MARLYIVQNSLITPEEYDEKKQMGTLPKAEEDDYESVPNPFTPIGIGKPLSIEIKTIYTGDYPNGVFGGKKDLMLCSAVKSSVTFEAAARAINKINKKASEKAFIEFNATEPGTRVVYYTSALDTHNTNVTFEMVADTFESEIFDTVSKLLSAAAGIPIFLPAATFLLGGSHVIKMAGSLGNTLFAKKAYMKDNYEIKFNNAGDIDTEARDVVIFNDLDRNAFEGFEAQLVQNNGESGFRLFHKQTGKEYAGPAPYLIISLDGQIKPHLDQFTPKLASAALLQKFYGEDDKQGAIAKTIEDAMQLYNDMHYKLKAQKLGELLKQLKEGTPEHAKNKALMEAYKKNIKTPEFN